MFRSTKRLFRDAERNARRRRNESVALTTETRYRCAVIYNDYRRGSIPGWDGSSTFSPAGEGKRGWNFAPSLLRRSHGFGLRRLRSRVEPSFPICVEPDTFAKGREIKIYRAAETDRVAVVVVGANPLDSRRVVPVDVDSRPPLLSIESTSLFRPFSYIESVAASAIDSASRDSSAKRASRFIAT